MTLFDVRTDDSHMWFVNLINRRLSEEDGRAYRERFGPVCGPRWLSCLDRGEIPVQVVTGVVCHVGPRSDEFVTDEVEDVVEVRSGDEVIAIYERLGVWSAPFRLGDRIAITRTRIELPHWTGPTLIILDVCAEWLPIATD